MLRCRGGCPDPEVLVPPAALFVSVQGALRVPEPADWILPPRVAEKDLGESACAFRVALLEVSPWAGCLGKRREGWMFRSMYFPELRQEDLPLDPELSPRNQAAWLRAVLCTSPTA